MKEQSFFWTVFPKISHLKSILGRVFFLHEQNLRNFCSTGAGHRVSSSVAATRMFVLGRNHECNCDMLLFPPRCLGAELQGAVVHPVHHRRILPQRQTHQGAGVLGPVHALAPHAQLHRPQQMVEERRLRVPLRPGPLPDTEDPAALSQRQHSDLQNAHGHLLQVQALQTPSQPVGGQGGPEEATQQEAQSLVSRPEQDQRAADGQLVLTLSQRPWTDTTHSRHTNRHVSFRERGDAVRLFREGKFIS